MTQKGNPCILSGDPEEDTALTLQEHIDERTHQVRAEIGRIGLRAAQEKTGVNRPYLSRFKSGKQSVSAKKVIEFAQALGLPE